LTDEERIGGGPHAVFKFLMILYELKQAGRLWKEMMHKQLLELKFLQ
jgi:hypothetical protein